MHDNLLKNQKRFNKIKGGNRELINKSIHVPAKSQRWTGKTWFDNDSIRNSMIKTGNFASNMAGIPTNRTGDFAISLDYSSLQKPKESIDEEPNSID